MAEGTAPPRIAAKPRERMLLDVLTHVVRGLSSGRQGAPKWFALKGGTALAAAYGLPRPSTDIDLDVARNVDIVERVRKILAQRQDIEVQRVDVKQRGHGYVRLWFSHSGFEEAFHTKIDVSVCDGVRKPRLDEGRIVMIDGLAVYDMPTLANQKLNALVGDGARVQPRDLYDAAWLTARHNDAITMDNKVRLHKWVRDFHEGAERTWREAFSEDRILAPPRCDCDEVVLALMSNLDEDEGLQDHLKTLRETPAPTGTPPRNRPSRNGHNP